MNYKEIFSHYNQYPVFTSRDMRILLKKNKELTKSTIGNMLRKKYIYRVDKGVYSNYNDASVVGFAYRPFYYGLQYALTIHNIWGQSTNPVIITSKKCRVGLRKALNMNIVLHRTKPKYIFGYDLIKQDNFNVPVSDLEKTFIDFVYYNIKLDKNTKQILLKRINKTKLNEYLVYYPKYLQTMIKNELRH